MNKNVSPSTGILAVQSPEGSGSWLRASTCASEAVDRRRLNSLGATAIKLLRGAGGTGCVCKLTVTSQVSSILHEQ